MENTDYTTCMLCEAACGLEVVHDGERIKSIRGDDDDVHSKGYICPKAVAIGDIAADPDRVREPMRRTADGWEPVSWEEAIRFAAERIAAIQEQHGKDAVAYYYGNPTAHDIGALLASLMTVQALGTKNAFSSASVDALPRQLASYLLYGTQAVIPVPDIDRTHMLLILGANPVVSNGSVMSLPNAKKRLKAIRARGGKIVVVDPRRTETAELADAHHPIRPGGDAFLLAAMLQTIFAEDLASPGRLGDFVDGIDRVRRAVAPFTPQAVADVVGISADDIATLARDFAGAESATCYGRMGTCTQRFGTITTVLIDALNLVTGNLDSPGGAMFATPAVDLGGLAATFGQSGSFARYRSRVSGYPEFNGEIPVAGMAEEMTTPGPGQIRALVIHAGNPVLSIPDGRKLDDALAGLDFMVAVDIYINETTRHADLILPTSFGLEHEHYPALAFGLSCHNVAKLSEAIVEPPSGVRHGWSVLRDLALAFLRSRGVLWRMGAAVLGALSGGGPRKILALAMKYGPHKLRIEDVEASPHGIDLGPLQPRLPEIVRHKDKRIDLWPDPVAEDMPRLEAELRKERANKKLSLVSRRHLRSNNSWMHNSRRLLKGKDRCTLLIHPSDASARGIDDGAIVEVTSSVGSIALPVAVSDEMMPGVVCAPHGFGHSRDGVQLSVASERPGVSINDITCASEIDALSGCSSFAVSVDVTAA